MLHVRNVSKSYGSFRAVQDVSFTARPGAVTGLLGPNGAGKTTLIRMITGYLTPSSGSICVADHDTVDDSARARAAIGYLPESAPLYPEMSVEGYLRSRAGLYGLRGSAARAAVDRAIERCWLPEMRRRRIGALSKGYRQRTGLAAALLHDPPVVVLDEPTSGLDPTQILAMRGLIRDLGTHKTVLVSSHILSEVEQTCDRVLIVARGTLRADGTPADLVSQSHLGTTGHDSCTVTFAADTNTDSAREMLQALSAVGSCVQDPTGLTFEVSAAPGAHDLCEAIARAARQCGMVIVQLRSSRPTLEQFFMKVVLSDDASQPVLSSQ